MALLSTSVRKNGESVFITISGTLDEATNFGGSDFSGVAFQECRSVTLDLKEIDRITSKGIRAWIQWLSKLDRSKKYSVLNCSRIFVSQANLIPELLPSWIEVKSLELPYFCEDCGHAYGDFHEVVNHKPPDHVPPTSPCPKCKQPGEFDTLPERYFQFLKRKLDRK